MKALTRLAGSVILGMLGGCWMDGVPLAAAAGDELALTLCRVMNVYSMKD
jgi:hypothetical protein